MKKFGRVLSLLRATAADATMSLRILGILLVVLFSLSGEWMGAFFALALSWVTTPAPGYLGQKYGSRFPTRFNLYVDFALAFISSLIFAIYMLHYAHGWVVLEMWVFSACSGLVMLYNIRKNTRDAPKAISLHMVLFHLCFQLIVTTTWFIYMSLGKGFAVPIGIMIFLQVLDRRKVRAWWHGRLS